MDNTCVCCGEIIPEGAQVCPICSEGDTFRAAMARPISAEFKVKDEVEQAFRDGCIVVKEGMVLRAVLMPEIITDDMILAELMSIATKLHDAARDEQLREVAELLYKESADGQQLFGDMEEGEDDES